MHSFKKILTPIVRAIDSDYFPTGAEKVREMVAAGLTQKAQEAGYTPLMVALLKRAQFGQTGG